MGTGTSTEPRMDGMGTEVLAVTPFLWSDEAHANSEVPICSLAPSQHGEAGVAYPSSAEAFLRAVESERGAIYGWRENALWQAASDTCEERNV